MANELPMPFATTDDIEARWHTPLTQEERRRACAALDDTTALITDECTRAGIDIASIPTATLRAITCAAVIRKLTTDDDHLGVTNSQQTAGGFSESFTYSNPMGDLYLTSAERKRLGLRRQRAFAADTDAASRPTVYWRRP